MPTAVILGVSGQDGAYLAHHLLERGYRVVGTSRDAQVASFERLERLGIRARIALESVSTADFRSVVRLLKKTRPDEIYSLAGQSSVDLSFDQPVETFESVTVATVNLLEAIRFIEQPIRLYNAASSECFGNTDSEPASERTAFRPRSPYAVAKAAAFWQVANYREAYGLFACSGILFNHESPLRPERFVTQKVVRAAVRISRGSRERLKLGRLDVQRDWGWAPEYVCAMWQMLQRDQPGDFVIATGETNPLAAFVEAAFAAVGLEWRDHVDEVAELRRPADILVSRADPSHAERVLGWKANRRMSEVARAMVAAEGERLDGDSRRR